MSHKIIQIISLIRCINAVYKDNTQTPIIGIALIENADGNRDIKLMDVTYDGKVGFPDEDVDFITLIESTELLRS